MTGMQEPSKALTAAAIAAAVSAVATGTAVSLWTVATDDRSIASTAFTSAFAVVAVVVGAVVAAARPRNGVGWFMLAGAALSALGGAGADLAYHGIVHDPGSVPGVSAIAIAGSATRSVGWYLLTLGVPMFFPDGAVLPSRRNWLPRAFVVVLVTAVLDPLTDKQADLTDLGSWQNPLGLPRPWDLLGGVAFLGHVPLAIVVTFGIVSQLRRRYRTGTPLQRQQLRLFLAAAVLPVVAAPIVFTVGFDLGPWVFGATVLPLPFAIGFAVLARGLYDLRTAANRTLVWLTLSAVVVAVYALVIAGIGNRLEVRGASWLPWVAAATVAMTFAPLRDVLQRGVNRLTYGRWDQPYDVLAALGQRLEASADITKLLARVVDELHSLGLADVAIHDADGRLVAGDTVTDNVTDAANGRVVPATRAQHLALPLAAYGNQVGTLLCTLPSDALRRRDRQLLDDLAGHLGGVLHARALTGDLQAARERLVLAREEERRRLRRDLHDGLGPALAGHLLRLDLLAAKAGHDLTPDLVALRADLGATMLDVRRVVEGLRPPALDELGLAGAVEQATHRLTAPSSLRLILVMNVTHPLPAAVEVAAYRIITEAVTNVVRHAAAQECHITIESTDTALLLRVRDDGKGTASGPTPGGNGLTTMRERAEELGGTFSFSVDGPTRVTASLPLTTTAAHEGGVS